MIKLNLSDNGVTLSGELTRHTVPKLANKPATMLFNQIIKQAQQQNVFILDLNDVVKVDTAGLAWLLAQVEIAQANACQLTLAHLPSELIKLAKLSAVDSFLPINSSL